MTYRPDSQQPDPPAQLNSAAPTMDCPGAATWSCGRRRGDRAETPLQDLRPAVQNNEPDAVGLRLDPLGQGTDEGPSGGAGGQRGSGPPDQLRGGEHTLGSRLFLSNPPAALPHVGHLMRPTGQAGRAKGGDRASQALGRPDQEHT